MRTDPHPSSRRLRQSLLIPQSAIRNPHSRSGVALVVTLLLLSIITFMTVTFLVVSRSQKGSVVTETEQAIARLAADMGLERAKTELLAPILASTNVFNYGLLVATNYVNPAGFATGVKGPINVSYKYADGTPLKPNDFMQNVANLLYNPRPPVFITNRLFGSNEFRYYLDLNRNGLYDANGFLPVIGKDGLPTDVTNFFVGDPEWIGSLERPEFLHSADNRFVNRYTYVVVPAGNTLDLNTMHNQAANPQKRTLNPQGRDFLRDQGVGTWEINLAAGLYDLNTNLYAWGGLYGDGFDTSTSSFFPPQGNAFVDAGSLLSYRYATRPYLLASVSTLFTNGPGVFSNDGIDGYTTAVQLNSSGFPRDPDYFPRQLTSFPWPGADNPNHFFNPQELFDESKTAPWVTPANLPSTITFTKRLLTAGVQTNSYDRYTFYRLLSQFGLDSAPEAPGKLNLNYCNVDTNGYVVSNMATNFIPWIPEQFFTNAAVRLLANAGYSAGSGLTNLLFVDNRGVTNLQVQIWPKNLYTPSVHRLLQLAANLYDAANIRTFNVPFATNGFPSVFRPVFLNNGSQIFITGYQEVTNASFLNLPVADTTTLPGRNTIRGPGPNQAMVWGIPLVIGAKKGLPSFNKLAMQTQVQVTRKLQFHRPGTSATAPVNELDQMFVVGVSNLIGVEAWNSYGTAFPRSLRMVVIPDLTVALTNLETRRLLNPTTWRYISPVVATNIAADSWPSYNPARESYSFITPLASRPGVPYTNHVFLTNSVYLAASDTFVPLPGFFERTPGTTNLHVPRWQLSLRTRLRFALIDTVLNRIVDYVNLDSAADPLDRQSVDITAALASDGNCGGSYTPNGSDGAMWCTNRPGGSTSDSVPTFGIMNQLEASLGHTSPTWNDANNAYPAGMTKAQAIAFFKGQFTPDYLAQSNTFAAPFQPVRTVTKVTEWQANDPLVHYTIGDLRDLRRTNSFELDKLVNPPLAFLGQVNRRYEPWGGTPKRQSVNAPLYEFKVKDPVARAYGRSDDWDFPTNKFPNLGWVGRVHRGTPWQTVYLKSPSVDIPTWQKWTGNGQLVTNFGQILPSLVSVVTNLAAIPASATAYDAYFSHPTNDWRLLDLFTTALNDNATRGQLSINQPNLAAWSAVLGGVVVLTNTPWLDASGNPRIDSNGRLMPAPVTIQPAGVYNASDATTWPPLARIVNAINTVRTKFPNQSFQTLGDILAVPELTVASPFLNGNILPTDPNYVLNDATCERIPQQILGLLKCDRNPRFVVYAFGQTLKPADRSLVTSGTFFGLCTNYQIVAEAATRTVIRIDGAPANPRAVIESFNVLPPD